MKLHSDNIGLMSPKSQKAIEDGLFPGATIGTLGLLSSRLYTNLLLNDNEELVSPVDGKTTLIGGTIRTHNSLNGDMDISKIKIKGEE
jgi:hypothetical protein